VNLGVGSEGEHEVALHLSAVGEPVADVPTATARSLLGVVFENGEVLDPLRARAHEGLADVAEPGGLGELPRLVAIEGGLDDLDHGADGLVHDRVGVCRSLDFLCFCHGFLHEFQGSLLDCFAAGGLA
jgi:hypothetical protein